MTHNRIKKITSPLLHIVFFWLKKPNNKEDRAAFEQAIRCLLYTSPSPRDRTRPRMPSSA